LLEKKCGMRNDVWLHGGAGRGPKVDVVANKNEDETKSCETKKYTLCARHGIQSCYGL